MSFACPINFQTVDENQVRLQAAEITALSLLYLLTGWMPLLLLLSFDFAVRVAGHVQFSPLCYIAKGIIVMCNLTPSKTDAAPKLFAAKIGLLFSFASLVLSITGYSTAALYLVSILALCAFFEAAFNFCIGCHVHGIWHRLELTITPLKD